LVMYSVWKISVVLDKHYTGYQLKKGRPTERHNNEGRHQIYATWDDICQTAIDRQEWRAWTTTQVLVTGRSKV